MKEHEIDPSEHFDGKSTKEIMEALEKFDIFEDRELENIKNDLSGDLDLSPHWK